MDSLNSVIDTSNTFGEFSSNYASVTSVGSTQFTYPNVWYTNWGYPESKTEKAFLVVRALMRAKVIRVQTLDKFFALMDEVVKVL